MKLTLKKTIASILCISMIPSMMTGCKKESTSYSHTDFAMGTVTNITPMEQVMIWNRQNKRSSTWKRNLKNNNCHGD